MPDPPQYDAFITYSHHDARAAARIQTFIERYRLPGGRRLRVYMDRTDIRSGDLGAEIRSALDASGSLLVCCSAWAARSEWVTREIETFLAGAPRPVALVLVTDDLPPSSVPDVIRDRELRYTNLRRAWRLGLLGPAGRTELVRLIAMVADVELRALIPWDRRRRLQRLAIATGIIAMAAIGGLSAPVSTWRVLPPPSVSMGYSIDAAEARGAELVVLARMPASSSRGYVEVWRGAPGTKGDMKWLEGNFNPKSRLLPIRLAEPALVGRALRALGIACDERLWIGEPLPDHFVALRPEVPDNYTPLSGEALVGFSDVWVAGRGLASRQSRVDELYAEATLPAGGPRLFDVSTGIAVSWGSTGIWIGTPISPSFASSGGLWHSDDGGMSFRTIEGFRSVHSILADEPAPGDVLVAEVARSAPPNTQVPVSIVRRSRIALGPTEGEWPEFDGPPHGEGDVLELVGRTENSRLIVRVGQSLYEQTRTPLWNWLRLRQ